VDLNIHSSIRLHGVALNLLSTRTTLPFYSKYVVVEQMSNNSITSAACKGERSGKGGSVK
jgi:hypothetical protein